MKHPTHKISEYIRNGHPCVYLDIKDIQHQPPFDASIIHSHEYYLIYLFESGTSIHNIELEKYTCSHNNISVVFPHQYHCLTLDKEAKGSVIIFSEELFCSELLRKELRAYSINMREKFNHILLTSDQFSEIKQLFQLANSMIDTQNVIQLEQTRHLIKLIILKLMDFTKKESLKQNEISESNVYLEFMDLIEINFKKIRSVRTYADMLHVTPKKLNTITKKFGDETALHLIHDRIFLESKRLLAFSDMSHKEISYELQFDSPSAFNKFVMKKSKLSPSDLQKQLAQMYTTGD